MSQYRILLALLPLSTLTFAAGCGQEEVKYEPVPPVEGISVQLPAVPNVQMRPIESDGAYTIWGASYYQRNRVHSADVADKEITVTGYIVKTNLPDAPECAVHKTGKADPEGCVAPVPTFWLADEKNAELNESMKVMGWASNFAQVYDAIQEYDSKGEDAETLHDTVWGVEIPNPLPAEGAKVKVTGTYSTVFNMASAGIESDPIMGIMTYKDMEVLEKAPELPTLPTVERKPRK